MLYIVMHSQRYDTLKIHMKQLPMRCNRIFKFDLIQHSAIQCNTIALNTTLYILSTSCMLLNFD